MGPRPSGLPTKAALVRFLAEAGEAEKADIARAFGLKGPCSSAVGPCARCCANWRAEARSAGADARASAPRGGLPPVGVADVVERDPDGELYVRLTKRTGDDAPPARLASTRAREGRRRAGAGLTGCWCGSNALRTASKPG